MAIKVGDKVKVVGNICSHRFNIGDIVTCIEVLPDGLTNFKGANGDSWMMARREYEPTQETLDIGTLSELGVQVGDVVEYTSDRTGCCILHCVARIDGEKYYNDKGACLNSVVSGWRLISRAQPKGPVITETVTTEVKRILPGVYGRISIHNNTHNDGKVLIRLADSAGEVNLDNCGHYMSRDDLTAAIETLTAVRDAMPQNGNT